MRGNSLRAQQFSDTKKTASLHSDAEMVGNPCGFPVQWSLPGSNRQPMPCKGIALPIELRPRIGVQEALRRPSERRGIVAKSLRS